MTRRAMIQMLTISVTLLAISALVQADEPIVPNAVMSAMAKLEVQPQDPAANFVVGKYYALTRGNWDKGLPMLALSSDSELKATAVLDLQQPEKAEAQVAVGDKWWDISAVTTEARRVNLQARAAYWYTKALPTVTSDYTKARLAKRLEEIRQASPVKDGELVGEYQLQSQFTKTAPKDRARLGKTGMGRLALHADGTGAEMSTAGDKVWPGRWTLVNKQVTFVYNTPSLGQAVVLVTKTKTGIALAGTRRWQSWEVSWTATKKP